MRVYVLPAERSGPEAVEVRALDGGPSLATVTLVNPMGSGTLDRFARRELPLIAWSGWSEASGGDGESGSAEASLMTWGPRGRAAFDDLCEGLAAHRASVWFRPRAGHALSDTPSCLQFLRKHGPGGLGLAADPVGLLAEPMIARADDHLARSMAALGGAPGVPCVVLTNAGKALAERPLHDGLIDPRLIASLWREHFPPDTPVVLLGEGLEEQLAILRGA